MTFELVMPTTKNRDTSETYHLAIMLNGKSGGINIKTGLTMNVVAGGISFCANVIE